jgi:hypothetical protein
MGQVGLDELKSLLSSADPNNIPATFPSIVSTAAFLNSSTGAGAHIVFFFQSLPNSDALSCAFMRFLFEKPSDGLMLKRGLDFFLLWIRASTAESLDAQITVLESLAPQVRAFLEVEQGNPNPSIALAQLIERSRLYPMPNATPLFTQTCDSRTFLENSPTFMRSARAAEIRGRLHLLTSRLFPTFLQPANFLPAKRPLPPLVSPPDVRLLKALESLAKGGNTNSLRIALQVVEQFLKAATWITPSVRIPRPPVPIFTAFELLQNPAEPQDPTVLLQIAIMCLIIQSDNPKFSSLIRKFAPVCDIDADLLIDLIQKPIENETLPTQEMPVPPTIPDQPSTEFRPLFQPFELEPEEPPSVAQPGIGEERIEDVAGKDPAHWFDGDSLTTWRVARLCVANMFDQIDPDGFGLLPA